MAGRIDGRRIDEHTIRAERSFAPGDDQLRLRAGRRARKYRLPRTTGAVTEPIARVDRDAVLDLPPARQVVEHRARVAVLRVGPGRDLGETGG